MTKEEFTQKYYNFANAASKGTGISPILILAQAYLESGGAKSSLASKYNNFFGIKATPNWTGKVVNLKTREQTKDGKDFFIVAKFRAYNSPADSFSDHIKFLKSNPRYEKAGLFNNPNNYALQADSLQRAGYATDTNYSKILKSVSNNFITTLKKISPLNSIVSILPFIFLFIIGKKFL
jgi:flagellum-specific peptidoglycan hydrolase FlgJ